jgi:HD-GYP domain-containing protein (c-di-GMP phosphodiesterase class II)
VTSLLIALLHERHPDLAAHSVQVGWLSVAVGEELGLTGAELTRLKHAAELHDIGKLAIPDTILAKPGPLSDGEWAVIRRHTLIGERILDGAPTYAGVGAIIRASHERFDGRGYPDRLAGSDIPLAARIIAVCDAYDAMTAPRAYRDRLDAEAAIGELHRRAGAQFDPAVVEAFAIVLDRRAVAPDADPRAAPAAA